MKNILKKLVPSAEHPPVPESARLRERARAAEAAGAEADRAARAAESALRVAIRSDDPAAIADAELQLDEALKIARRNKIAAEEFANAADTALIAEREKIVLDEADAADREAEQVSVDLERQYPELARKVVELLKRVEASENRCREAEALLATIGKHRHIEGPQERAFPPPVGQFAGLFEIVTGTRLPVVVDANGEPLPGVASWPIEEFPMLPPKALPPLPPPPRRIGPFGTG